MLLMLLIICLYASVCACNHVINNKSWCSNLLMTMLLKQNPFKKKSYQKCQRFIVEFFLKSSNKKVNIKPLVRHVAPPVAFWNDYKNAYPRHKDLTKYSPAIYSNATKWQVQITCCDYSSSGQNTCCNIVTRCNYVDFSGME